VTGVLFAAASAMVAAMILAWELTNRTGNAGLVDVIWTFGIGVAGLTIALAPWGEAPVQPRQIMVAAMTALWSLRLGGDLWRRNVGGPEDARYTALRAKWGDDFQRRLFGFLMIQAAAGLLLATGIALAARNPMKLGLPDALGVSIQIAALLGSKLSDGQLARFKRDPANRGRICDIGLWSISRHPNYVCEVLYWAGWLPMAVSGFWLPGLAAAISPAFIYLLLRHVSGVPPLEAHMADRYGVAFSAYCRRVPPFFPYPPHRRP
jgi:steroid 5-alpha reductase family enzyme